MRLASDKPIAPRLILLAALVLPAAHSSAQAPELPLQAPIPQLRTPIAPPPPAARDIPVPEAREARPPSAEPDGETPPTAAQPVPVPETVPIPQPRPGDDDLDLAPPPVSAPAPQPADPRSAERPADDLPPEEQACRRRLTALGVVFENRPARQEAAGCSIPYPVVVTSLARDIALQPEAEMNCAMAEASARFVGDVVAPAARTIFGQELAAVGHASAYVCRPRNGTRKLSEHAFGNALDIAAFILADGARIEVMERPGEREARFLGAVRKAACGPFRTVLGPGSDADHALHFHFDLAPRRSGGTFCQ